MASAWKRYGGDKYFNYKQRFRELPTSLFISLIISPQRTTCMPDAYIIHGLANKEIWNLYTELAAANYLPSAEPAPLGSHCLQLLFLNHSSVLKRDTGGTGRRRLNFHCLHTVNLASGLKLSATLKPLRIEMRRIR